MIGDELKSEYRIGLGTDIHVLVPERRLMLGGVHIPFEAGLKAHSDGDVVLHAVMDALLGAAGMGDIGTIFPDDDPQTQDADSKGLLLDIKERLNARKWEVINLDVTVHGERPRLEPYKGQIRRCIAGLLDMDFACVNIKAKTNEGVDAVGRGEAIAASAIVLIRERRRKAMLK